MRYNLVNGKIEIDLNDILRNLSAEEKRAIAEDLVWDDDIFRDFVDRLMTNEVVTDQMSRGIYEARLRFMELLPVMEQEVVRSLLHMLEQERNEKARYHSWSWDMYHAWPKEYARELPEIPKFEMAGWANTEAVRAAMQEERAKL